MEQAPRICPLCGAPVRLFFLNLSEQLLMCEDTTCDFPFGYEELQIVTDEKQLKDTYETASSISLGPYNDQSAASSVISTAAWSDIEKLNRVYDSEDSMADSRLSFTSDAVKMHRQRMKTQNEIQKNLDHIKKLNEELNELKNTDSSIQKADWLNNLMSLQGVSGRQLLKANEMNKLKKKEPDFGMGELKININTVPNNDGLINIEIINEENELENKKDIQENKIQIQLEEIENMNENDGQGKHQKDKNININLATNQQEMESMDTEPILQETEEIVNQINNDVNLKETPSNDTLSNMNMSLNEINNFTIDSDINHDDSNLVDVKTVVIDSNSFTVIELKGDVQDTNYSQRETDNIEGDIEIDSSITTLVTSNELNEDNINKPQDHDIINDSTGANKKNTTLTYSNNNHSGSNTSQSVTSGINKDTNLSLETEKLELKYETTGKRKKGKNNNANTEYEKQCEKEENHEDKLNNSNKLDLMNSSIQSDAMNNSKDQEDIINNLKESEDEVKIPKKRGRPKKTTKTHEQPIRRSGRLSK